jgi:hypothetical protein
VCHCHFDTLLELKNGDDEDACITSDELAALQVAGYCNEVMLHL